MCHHLNILIKIFNLSKKLVILITMDQNKIKFINLINLINATDNLEYHNFINYITTNYIYFYQFISAIKKQNKVIVFNIQTTS